MKFFKSILLSAISIPVFLSLADPAQVAPYVTAFYGDLQANLAQYLSYIGGGASVPPVLFQLYTEVSTYTDDSYTTLISSDFPIDQLSDFVTGLPWYSTRLSAELAAAAGAGSSEATSTAAESSSAEATSSPLVTSSSIPASETSSASSVISSIASSVAASSSSASLAPSISESSPSSGAAAIAGGPTNPMILVPLIGLSAGFLLL